MKNKMCEEEVIKDVIERAESLHGSSSEGKTARVKQIDPTCEIIHLRNATPDSLNGKSVYNQATGEMIDVKPLWLKELEEKCEKEPDRIHTVFLDGKVNSIWKLPDNARIVAANNDTKDSLVANQFAEQLDSLHSYETESETKGKSR